MSAGNWAVCPRCLKKAEDDKANQQRRAQEAYGNVEPDVFIEMLADSRKEIDKQALRTLHEDYELVILEDGEFYVIYHGKCKTCGLERGFKLNKMLDI